MSRCLFKVEDCFLIKGRGLFLAPGILPVGDELFRVGDALVLKRPDGTSFTTTIGGLEILTPNQRLDVVVSLKGMTKQDVPIGTEVWSKDQSEALRNTPNVTVDNERRAIEGA